MRLFPPTRFLLLLLGPDLPLLPGESEAVGVRLKTGSLHPSGHELVHYFTVRSRLLRRKVLIDRLLLPTYLNFDFGHLEVDDVLLRVAASQVEVVLGSSTGAGSRFLLLRRARNRRLALVLARRLGLVGLELKNMVTLKWVGLWVRWQAEGRLGRQRLLRPILVLCSSL